MPISGFISCILVAIPKFFDKSDPAKSRINEKIYCKPENVKKFNVANFFDVISLHNS